MINKNILNVFNFLKINLKRNIKIIQIYFLNRQIVYICLFTIYNIN